MKHTILVAGVAAGLQVLMGVALWAGPADVQPVLDKMPSANATERDTAFAEIVKGGKAAVLAVCEAVVAPETGGDSKARYAIGGLAFYVSRPGAEAERKMCAEAILESAQKAKHDEIKSFLLGLLRWCGGKECVPALGAFLDDPNLVEPATMALCSIRAEGTGDRLLKALQNAKGKQAATLVKALGELRVASAVPAIAKFAADGDRDLRRTALYALANIGDDGAEGKTLRAACQAEDFLEKSMSARLTLLYGQRLAEAGKKAQGASVCREVAALASKPGCGHFLPTALNTLAGIEGDKAIPDVVAALNGSDRVASVAAMNTLIAMKSANAAEELGKVLKDGAPHLRLALLDTLAPSDNQALVESIALNLKHEDKAIRTAAIRAITGKSGLPSLLQSLRAGDTNDLPELQKAILFSAGKNEMKDIASALAGAPVSARVVLLDILGQRGARSQADAVFGSLGDPDSAVRAAAMKALGSVASPEHLQPMVKLFLGAKEEAEEAALLKSMVAVAKTIPEPGKRADVFLSALPSAAGGKKVMILGALPDIGGPTALDAVIASIGAGDENTRDASVRALSDWPTADAAPAMIKAAGSATNLTQQVLLIRGYVRLVRAGDMKPETKVGMCKQALALARRPDEKKLVLGAMTVIKTVESLIVVGSYFDDPAVKEEAARLAVLIACPTKGYTGLSDPAVKPVLEKAAAIVKDDKTRKQIKNHIARIK